MPLYNHHPFPSKQLTRIKRGAALLHARRRLRPPSLLPPSSLFLRQSNHSRFPIPAVSRSLGRSNYLTFMATATAAQPLPCLLARLPACLGPSEASGRVGGWVSECSGRLSDSAPCFPDPQARLFVFLRYGLLSLLPDPDPIYNS